MIKGPKNAVPTLKGWVSPKGELLKSQRITQAQIDEWYGVAPDPVEEAPVVEEVVELDELLHSHGEEEHSHDDGDVDHHHHDDGTVHDHDGGEEEHTHEVAEESEPVKPKKRRSRKTVFGKLFGN